ncbi:hypothetical protein BC833DRAFT_529148 [Globomyces pollinis-pini]|nr:hypothetical protein BC833DRAFT_529148 [Globomyces pollinis-pini]
MIKILGILLILIHTIFAGTNYYKVLEVPQSATKKQIKSKYRELSKKYHPDKNPDGESKFVEIAQAYEVLIDDEKRRIYDQYGEEGLKQGGQQFHNPFDIFSQFGGGFRGNQNRQERKGHSIEIELSVTLEELYNGNSIEVEINKQIICPICRGSGAKSHEHVKTCNQCGGNGIVIQKQQFMPGIYQTIQTTCNVCGGKGKQITSKCKSCNGMKVKRGSTQVMVTIERGMADGTVIEFEGESDQSPDAAAGDALFILRQTPHKVFTRRGLNLYTKHSITLKQSLLGFKETIKHLDGTLIKLERSGITPNGKWYPSLILGFVDTLEGQGFPKHFYPDEKGQLYVEYQVIFPTTLTESQQKGIYLFRLNFRIEGVAVVVYINKLHCLLMILLFLAFIL